MKKFLSILLVLALCIMGAAFAEEITGSWTTSNSAVAVVDDSGKVTAVGVGEADVSFTDANGNVSVTRITVVELICVACGEYVDESNAEEHAPCLSCGMFACQEGYDELDHDTVINQFCKTEPQHRACAAYRDHHCDSCGRDYDCSLSGSHTTCIKCGLPWCDKTSRGNHANPDCGDSNHRPCQLGRKFDEDDHEWCGYCKKYKCRTSSKIKHGDDKGECGYKEPEVKCSGCGEVGVQHTITLNCCGALECDTSWSHSNSCDHCYQNADAGEHAKCACGDTYLCWNRKGHGRNECNPPIVCEAGCGAEVSSADAHLLPCEHYSCLGGNHGKMDCGHYACANGDHGRCSYCANYLCNGDDHGDDEGQCGYVPPVICSYCGTEGSQHNAAPCGQHCVEQNGDHTKCICGGWSCIGTHGEMQCGHYCKQNESGHEACPYGCGGYLCNGKSHGTGEGQCSYVPPITCEAGCGATLSSPSGHKLSCGHYSCKGGNHDKLDCGHYACAGGDHDKCRHCANYICDGGNHGDGEGQCGYVPPRCSDCGEVGEQHRKADCGNHCVNESGNHSRCDGCDGYKCNGKDHGGNYDCGHCNAVSAGSWGHGWCYGCDSPLCRGDHSSCSA